METLYVIFRYGPLGVADVQYAKIRKGHRIDWIRDRSKASGFKKSRAEAMQRGAHSVSRANDWVIEER